MMQGINWINLVQTIGKGQALVHTAIILQAHKIKGMS
jgi:hypothetical protein